MTEGIWRRSVGMAALMVAASFVLAGCNDSPSGGGEPVIYQGEVAGVGEFGELTGAASMNVTTGGVGISVTLQGAPDANGGFPWVLREGSCQAPGAEVGEGEMVEYPPIVVGPEGSWSGTVTVSADQPDRFVLDIRRSQEEPNTPLACGELDRATD